MGKNSKAAAQDQVETGSGTQTVKAPRQRGKATIASLFAEFITELKSYAQEQYDRVRFNTEASDEQLAARDRLRKAVASLETSKS
jgi:hypothetical protein